MKQKKGFAFIEMESAEAAARAVQQLDGTLHRNRTLRLSFEIKASKARSVSVKRYKERGDAYARQKAKAQQLAQGTLSTDMPSCQRRPERGGDRPVYKRSAGPDSVYNSRERSAGTQSRPAKPHPRAGGRGRPVFKRAAGPDSGYNSRERAAGTQSRPAKPHPRAGVGDRPVFKRAAGPDSGYNSRERAAGTQARPVGSHPRSGSGAGRFEKRPRSAERALRSAHKPGDSRPDGPQRNKTRSDSPRDYSKPRSASGARPGFDKPSQPGARGAGRPAGSARSSSRNTSSGRGRSPRRN